MLYTLLGTAKDDALAQRALALSLTDEPGKTTSAAIIGRVAGRHADAAVDFVDAHQAQVDTLIDASARVRRSEEHTSELQSLMRISYAVFCLKQKNKKNN